MNPAKTHGAFSWSELMTTDASAAGEFYANLLGYQVEVADMESGPYTMLKLGQTPVAGVMNLPEGEEAPPAWVFYVTVDDVDAAAERCRSLGAQQVWPMTDVPDVGRMTGFLDPQGAYFAMIQYAYPDMEGTPEPNFGDAFVTHGAFSWFELRSPDVAAAKEFYLAVFGWNIKDQEMAGGFSYPVIHVGETGVGGMIPPPASGIPAHWAGYITVDDSDAIAKSAEEAGGSVIASMDMPSVGKMHVFQDPQGAAITVIKYVPMDQPQDV